MDITLTKFHYKYLAYEHELLKLELQTLVPHVSYEDKGNQMLLHNVRISDVDLLKRLTYIASYSINGVQYFTHQYLLEQNNGQKLKRQNTRYASHGIHEYKGKFNPQIVHSLINIFGLSSQDVVLDPFCGSGTTLLESTICGIESFGIDINPLAIQLSLLKTQILSVDCDDAKKALSQILIALKIDRDSEYKEENSARYHYLQKWIPQDTLFVLERLLELLSGLDSTVALFFKLIASGLIREYSLQEPLDLRIRKRKSPLPEQPFADAWAETVMCQIERIGTAQCRLPLDQLKSTATLGDIRNFQTNGKMFDVAITSPPYATALPYIDTQRISLVWLGLCEPDEIMNLERSLIGSREFYKIQKEELHDKMLMNEAELPQCVIEFVMYLHNKLSKQDGFRKKAVPLLLYRYFSDMKLMFNNVYTIMKPNAKYALVVGCNRTTIGGELHTINTPEMLSEVGKQCGWGVNDMFALQTYQRYGLNAKNGINQEVLILLEKDTN